MGSYIHNFTTRQRMITPDYEYFHYKGRKPLDIEYHNHDFYEVYHFISGHVTYLVEGRSYNLSPGDILLIHNRELHKPVIHGNGPYERRVLWVSPEYLHKASDENTDLAMCFESPSSENYNLVRPSGKMQETILETQARFERILEGKGFGINILKKLYLVEYLVYVNKAYLESCKSKSSSDIYFDEKVNDIIRYINKNLEKNLSLDFLSDKFFTSKYHLTRQFKKFTGYTLHKYILQKRLIRAKSMLREGTRINEICIRCGFNDYSNFIRSFKQTYGLPPKKYASKNFSR